MQPVHPTIIIVHEKERRSKCTVEPLRGRSDFEFHKFPLKTRPDVSHCVRLGIGGEPLSPADRTQGLLVLDATWKLAGLMEAEFAEVPIRSLPAAETAYPRNSKLYEDPDQGLATIEAIYLSYLILGYSTDGLLDQYYWRDDFLDRNRELFESLA
ncbi:MAG: hypothetical protein KDA78_13965 [Planctomycetaceae bacterium]|nr:hypothetical protein [Planctomycetaceae bacterium]